MYETRVIDIYRELKSFDMEVYDPWADPQEVMHEYGIEVINGNTKNNLDQYSAIIIAVAHKEFKSWPIQKSESQVVFDVKSVLGKEIVDARL